MCTHVETIRAIRKGDPKALAVGKLMKAGLEAGRTYKNMPGARKVVAAYTKATTPAKAVTKMTEPVRVTVYTSINSLWVYNPLAGTVTRTPIEGTASPSDHNVGTHKVAAVTEVANSLVVEYTDGTYSRATLRSKEVVTV